MASRLPRLDSEQCPKLRSIRIDSFEGSKQDLTEGFSAEQADQLLNNLFVEAQLMEGDAPIGLPSRTLYACYGGDGSRGGGGHRLQTKQCRWNDLLTFRCAIRQKRERGHTLPAVSCAVSVHRRHHVMKALSRHAAEHASPGHRAFCGVSGR